MNILMKTSLKTALTCPIEVDRSEVIQLGHGGGGKLTAKLVREIFGPAFSSANSDCRNDQATVPFGERSLAFTTDSYVVDPIFFPGGDIGELAINGTVNDLCMGGARPLYVSAGFVLEEGFPIADLKRVVASMKAACEKAGVELVTGDTKVVDKGKADKIFITTAGVGMMPPGVRCSVDRVSVGDKIIINGPIGNHGITILTQREGMEFDSTLESDTCELSSMVMSLVEKYDVHCMRDLTRGGLASATVEIAQGSGKGMEMEEELVPVDEAVVSACEIFGLDPLFIANEGKMIAFVPEEDADGFLEAMKKHHHGRQACIIGEVTDAHAGMVLMKNGLGGNRIVEMMSGEQLPRIC